MPLTVATHCQAPRRWNSIVQFVSHVMPSSSENACSHVGFRPGFTRHAKRILIGLPSSVSSAKKRPTVPSKWPITGTSSVCGARPSSHQIAQLCVCGLNERKAAARTSPSGKLRTLSSTFPNPPRIFCVVVRPSNSHHSVDPQRRALSRRCRTSQCPMMKSKSDGAAVACEVDIGVFENAAKWTSEA